MGAFANFEHELSGTGREHVDFNGFLALTHLAVSATYIHTGTYVAQNDLASLSLFYHPEVLEVFGSIDSVNQFFDIQTFG